MSPSPRRPCHRARWRPSPAVVVAGIALAAAAGGVAVAAPGDGGTIYACTNNLRGNLRVVDQGVACAADETLLSWNQQGPVGPAGSAGPPGERGPQGPSVAAVDRPPAVDAALQRADRSFAKRPPSPSKRLIARLKATDPAAGEARSVYRDGVVSLPSAIAEFVGGKESPPLVVASLVLPAGRWTVNAKAQASVVAAGDTYDTVTCRLAAGVDADRASFSGFSGILALQLVHRFTKPGLVQLACYGLLQPKVREVKITAVRVAKLTNEPVSG